MKQIYDNKDIGETIDKSFDAGIKEGYRICMEQMMKDAVGGRVILRDMYDNRSLDIDFVLSDNLKIGDKVKVIIVKED